jgi:hypothetical protein
MIDRVHGDASDFRSLAHPSSFSSFAPHNILMFDITDLSHRGPALKSHKPHFAGRQSQMSMSAFLCDQLGVCARASGHLSAFPWLQLHGMNDGPQGKVS